MSAFAEILPLAWSRLLDLVYPPACLVCGASDSATLCERCYGSFAPIPEPICVTCGRPDVPGLIDGCATCAAARSIWPEGWSFDAARASGIYQGALREAIHRLKYGGERGLARPLGEYLAARCVHDGMLDTLLPEISAAMVVPVPVHKSRLRERGFNQAELIAAPLADSLRAPMCTRLVTKIKQTSHQVGLSGSRRRRNVGSEMFVVNRESVAEIAGRTVLLVDDVFTTGATVNACARALRDSGATRIVVVALASGA